MSRGNWNKIKQSKFFYVMTYRKLLTSIIVFQALNVVLFLGIAFLYMKRPEPQYYATSGIALPILLEPIDAPNASSEALLPPDPVIVETNKVMPQ